MISGYLNSILGLALVYISILKVSLLEMHPWGIVIAGALIIALSAWSRTGDMMQWFSSVKIVLGAILLLFGVWDYVAPFAHLFVFWFVFWTGALVGVVALWAAIYRPKSPRFLAPESSVARHRA